MVKKTFSMCEVTSFFLYKSVIDSEEYWRILIFSRDTPKSQTNELC